MNILVLYKDGDKGGVAINTKELVEGLRKRKIHTVVMGSDGTGTQSILSHLNVHVVNFSSKNPFLIYSKINHIIKDNDINLIHAQNRLPALYASLICFFHKKVKYVWANHQVPIPTDFFHRIMTRYGEGAITASTDGYYLLTEKLRIPKDKVSIVNLGVDIQKFKPVPAEERERSRQKFRIKDCEKVILLYGRLTENKGHMFFLRALSKLNCLPKIKIIFPGDGSEDYKAQLITYADSIGLAENIIFPGFADGKELLSIADLMILPSEQEGYPISCIEAFCMGVPVIRTKTGGYEDTKEYCTGVVYGDVETLSKELSAFLSEDEKFKEKTKAALEHREQFSVGYMLNQYINIYDEIIKAKNT